MKNIIKKINKFDNICFIVDISVYSLFLILIAIALLFNFEFFGHITCLCCTGFLFLELAVKNAFYRTYLNNISKEVKNTEEEI